MPQSKSRRGRRNRQNKRRQPVVSAEAQPAAKVNSQEAKVTEPSSSGSIARRRYRLQLHSLNSSPKICEITTLRDERLSAYVGHIDGVGIIDTTVNDTKTIVTEPVEPLAPLASHVNTRVTNLGKEAFDLAPIPPRSRPEIREVVDSDADEASVSRETIVELAGEKNSENQSDCKKPDGSTVNRAQKGCAGLARHGLRSFKIPSFGIVTEPESDSDQPGINQETLESYATFSDASVELGDLNEVSEEEGEKKAILRAVISEGQEEGIGLEAYALLESCQTAPESSPQDKGDEGLVDECLEDKAGALFELTGSLDTSSIVSKANDALTSSDRCIVTEKNSPVLSEPTEKNCKSENRAQALSEQNEAITTGQNASVPLTNVENSGRRLKGSGQRPRPNYVPQPFGIVTEPDSDSDLPQPCLLTEVIFEETEEESDYSDNNRQAEVINKPAALPTYPSLSSEEADSERTIIDSLSETEVEEEVEEEKDEPVKESNNTSKESAGCNDNTNSPTIDLKTTEITGASCVSEIDNETVKIHELNESERCQVQTSKIPRQFNLDISYICGDNNNLLNNQTRNINVNEVTQPSCDQYLDGVQENSGKKFSSLGSSSENRSGDLMGSEQHPSPHKQTNFATSEFRRQESESTTILEKQHNSTTFALKALSSPFVNGSGNLRGEKSSEIFSTCLDDPLPIHSHITTSTKPFEERYLDIIQEETENYSHDKYIRDFINEEISKFRRVEKRTTPDVIGRDSGSKNSPLADLNGHANEINQSGLNDRGAPPEPPKRSSSIEVKSHDVAPRVPTLPTEFQTDPPRIPNRPSEGFNSLLENPSFPKYLPNDLDQSTPSQLRNCELFGSDATGVTKIDIGDSNKVKKPVSSKNTSEVVSNGCRMEPGISGGVTSSGESTRSEVSSREVTTTRTVTESFEKFETTTTRLGSLDESSSGTPSPNTVRHVSEDEADRLRDLDTCPEPSSAVEPGGRSEIVDERSESLIQRFEKVREVTLAGANSTLSPTPLRDLCIRRILSLPHGNDLLSQLATPSFSIFKSLNSIQESVKSYQPTMKKQRPTTWTGLPTSDPHLLVCLSPSQRDNIHTSADNLLDLHSKFLNRSSCDRNQTKSMINVPKYHVELNQSPETSKNRLLEIVKENKVLDNDNQVAPDFSAARQQFDQIRESSKRFNETLGKISSALVLRTPEGMHERRGYVETSPTSIMKAGVGEDQGQGRKDIFNGDFEEKCEQPRRTPVPAFIERSEVQADGQGHKVNLTKTLDPSKQVNPCLIDDRPDPPPRTPVSFFVDRGDGRKVNPALIDNRPEPPPRCRRTVGVDRSCIDTTSIFDKAPPRGHLQQRKFAETYETYDRFGSESRRFEDGFETGTDDEIAELTSRSYRDNNKGSLTQGLGNASSARVIEDVDLELKKHREELNKLSSPQEVLKTITRPGRTQGQRPQSSIVDFTSKEYQEGLKTNTASEIVDNLKKLQRDVQGMFQDRRRYSLPQEYFDRQMEYIETLENQLQEVIIAEEEEAKAYDNFKKVQGLRAQAPKTDITKERKSDYRKTWHEESMTKKIEVTTSEHTSQGSLSRAQNPNLSKQTQSENSCKMPQDQKIPEENKCESSSLRSQGSGPEKITKIGENSDFRRTWHIESPTKKSQDGDKVGDSGKPCQRPKSISVQPSQNEVFRRQMYDEYVHKVLEREERKHHKLIKISSHADLDTTDRVKDNMTTVEKEFIEKAKKRLNRFGIDLDETEVQRDESVEVEGKCIVDGKEIKDAKELPKHLQEFIKMAISELEDGVWSPGSTVEPLSESKKEPSPERGRNTSTTDSNNKDASIPPVWTPSSAGQSPIVEKKEFRPVQFESPILSRKNKLQTQGSSEDIPPWKHQEDTRTTADESITTRIVNSHSVPSEGLNNLATTPRLPRAQNPTITLLQKAREGQLPKGAAYLEEQAEGEKSHEGARVSPGEIIYTVKREYESEPESSERPKKMADLGPRKMAGIGPVTKDGMPVALRSEIKETNQSKWYKQMYDSLHRAGKKDDYETIRYKQRRGTPRYGYGTASGYLSEPEPRVSADRSATLDTTRRRQRNKENDAATSTMPRKNAVVKTTAEVYRNQPGRIEHYQPGRSSISDKETKEWWDEVMDIFDGPFDQRHPPANKPYMSHALKESGYESDSTLIFRRRDDVSPLSPLEQRLAYKTVQKGGDVPLHGLRKPAPERPKEYTNAPPPPPKTHQSRIERPESPRRYVESEVTIHYRSPVRTEAKEILSEEELARRSAENMRRIYQEERRRKYLQELHDIDSRRHTDNFTPSQKSPIPLNRYDDFMDDSSYRSRSQEHTPEPRLLARALYNFVGQTSRELSFRRGDIIVIRRQIDKNWYEGEHNAMIGLFPLNYVEILPYDSSRGTPKKSYEGQARAKFNFLAQTNLELSLAKGELVVLTRRVDENWFEGRIGNKKGIFPVSYVEVICEPGQHRPETPVSSKPVASPAAHSLLSNGTSSGKLSMGPHHYVPSMPVKTSSSSEPQYISLPRIGVTERNKLHVAPVNETLHIDTHSDSIPYRALYNYRPQNEDELELKEGDTVYVMEKCDDGWYVGSSQRTGYFGTFPGNYVERL